MLMYIIFLAQLGGGIFGGGGSGQGGTHYVSCPPSNCVNGHLYVCSNNASTYIGQGAPGTCVLLTTVDPNGTFLPLAGGTLTGQMSAANTGVEFNESDTNPACSGGNYNIFADLSEHKLKKCVDGTYSAIGAGPFSDLAPGENNNALVIGTGGSLTTTGSGAITATNVVCPGTCITGAEISKSSFVGVGGLNLGDLCGGSIGDGKACTYDQGSNQMIWTGPFIGGGTCGANTVVTATSGPTCTDLTDAYIPDTITASNYLPLAGSTMTGTITGKSAGDNITLPAYTSGTVATSIRYDTRGLEPQPWRTFANGAVPFNFAGDHDHPLITAYNLHWDSTNGLVRDSAASHAIRIGYETRYTVLDPNTNRGSFEFNIDIDPNLGTTTWTSTPVRPFFLGYAMDSPRNTVFTIGDPLSNPVYGDESSLALNTGGKCGFCFYKGIGGGGGDSIEFGSETKMGPVIASEQIGGSSSDPNFVVLGASALAFDGLYVGDRVTLTGACAGNATTGIIYNYVGSTKRAYISPVATGATGATCNYSTRQDNGSNFSQGRIVFDPGFTRTGGASQGISDYAPMIRNTQYTDPNQIGSNGILEILSGLDPNGRAQIIHLGKDDRASKIRVGDNFDTSRFSIKGNTDILQMVVKANSSQDNDIFQVQNSSGTVMSVAPWGSRTGAAVRIGAAQTFNKGLLQVEADADNVQFYVRGNGTQTNPVVKIEKSDASSIMSISNTGVITGTVTANWNTDTKCINVDPNNTTTSWLFWRTTKAVTVTSIDCITDAAGTVEMTLRECNGNAASCGDVEPVMTCGTTNTQVAGGSIDNPAIEAGNWMRVTRGNITSTPVQVSLCMTYTTP